MTRGIKAKRHKTNDIKQGLCVRAAEQAHKLLTIWITSEWRFVCRNGSICITQSPSQVDSWTLSWSTFRFSSSHSVVHYMRSLTCYSINQESVSLRCISVLSSNLLLGVPRSLLLQVLPTRISHIFLVSLYVWCAKFFPFQTSLFNHLSSNW